MDGREMNKLPPFIPPYFAYDQTASGEIKIFRPGRELCGLVRSFDEYLAFIRTQTEAARERYEANLRERTEQQEVYHATSSLRLNLEL